MVLSSVVGTGLWILFDLIETNKGCMPIERWDWGATMVKHTASHSSIFAIASRALIK